jgi:hypothetical protein
MALPNEEEENQPVCSFYNERGAKGKQEKISCVAVEIDACYFYFV